MGVLHPAEGGDFFMPIKPVKRKLAKSADSPRRGGNYRNNELAARVLAEAAFYGGGAKVAEKYGFTSRSFLNWQNELENDPQLSALYLKALSTLAHQRWAEDLNASIRRSVEKITTMIEALEPTPDNLRVALDAVQQLMRWEQNRVVAELEIARFGQERLEGFAGGDSEHLPETPTHQA